MAGLSAGVGHPGSASASRAPGPTRPCPPSRIGTVAAAAAAVSSASHGSRTRSAQQQVARETVLGPRPATLVGAQSMGEQHPRVQERAVREIRDVPADAPGAVPVQQQAQDAPRRAPVGTSDQRPRRRRPQTALLDQRPRPGSRLPLQPAQVRRRHAARDEELRAGVARERPEHREPRPDGRRIRVRRQRQVARCSPGAVEQQQVQRRVHVRRQPAPRAEVRDRESRPPRPASGAARCPRRAPRGGTAGQGPPARWRSRPPSSGGSRGPPVACPRRTRRTPGGLRVSRAGSSRRRGPRGPRVAAPRRGGGGARRMGYRRAARDGRRPRRRRRRGSHGGGAPPGPLARRRGSAPADRHRPRARARG